MDETTKCVHVPGVSTDGFASLTVPAYRASTVVYDTAEAFRRRGENFFDGYAYGLYGTPTTKMLEAQLAGLDNATRAVLVPSGLAAITLVNLAFLKPGDEVLIPDTAYAPVREVCRELLAPLGIGTRFYDPLVGADIADLFSPATRLVWVESPGSLTMEVQDVPAITAAARSRGIVTAADNTWATSLLFKPLDHGVDIAMQAASKYIVGHSDVLMGVLCARDEAVYRRLKLHAKFLGYGVSPEDCALTIRSLATLPIRLRQSERSAALVMKWLASQPEVASILHPSVPTHPGHRIWQRDFAGGSGVFSVVFKPCPPLGLDAALDALRLFKIGASWGGAHSLVAPVDPRSVRTARPWLHEGALVRFSIGLEEPDDLIADLERAFLVLRACVPMSTTGQAAE